MKNYSYGILLIYTKINLILFPDNSPLIFKNKNDNSTKKKSGKKNKSSKSKTAKSKLASKILSSNNGDQNTSEDNDEGRNTNAVVLDNSNVFMDTIKDTILKDLKDTDFVMETPSAAIFTLVVGKNDFIIRKANSKHFRYQKHI